MLTLSKPRGSLRHDSLLYQGFLGEKVLWNLGLTNTLQVIIKENMCNISKFPPLNCNDKWNPFLPKKMLQQLWKSKIYYEAWKIFFLFIVDIKQLLHLNFKRNIANLKFYKKISSMDHQSFLWFLTRYNLWSKK